LISYFAWSVEQIGVHKGVGWIEGGRGEGVINTGRLVIRIVKEASMG